MDGFFLGFVTAELRQKLLGARVDRVLQPEKDELHLLLRRGETYRLLLCASANHPRAHISQIAKPNPTEPPMFCMLLRKLLGGSRVVSIDQIEGDRILEIVFAISDEMGDRAERILSVEMMGKHSNIILRDNEGRILDSIRHIGANVNRVRELKPGALYIPPPSQGKLHPFNAHPEAIVQALQKAGSRFNRAIAESFTGIGADTAKEMAYRLTAQESPYLEAEERIKYSLPLYDLFRAMAEEDPPVLIQSEAGETVNVFPIPQKRIDPALQMPVPEGHSAALDLFYRNRDLRDRMAQKSSALSRTLKTHIERHENKLAVYREILSDETSALEARRAGELITANLYQMEKGNSEFAARDYETGGIQIIKLDPTLSPTHNAQKYFKRYQKLKEAKRRAILLQEQAAKELSTLEANYDDVRKCDDARELDEIREELVRLRFLKASHSRKKQAKPQPSKPIACRSTDGIMIKIGKNSAQNDRLTQSAPPDVIWLHAKNLAGSHVIIESRDPPEQTLHEAAMLAAWFSRGWQSTNVPVDYTLKKHVKKPSGAAAGFVTYTNQRTLFVTPDEREVNRLLILIPAPKGDV